MERRFFLKTFLSAESLWEVAQGNQRLLPPILWLYFSLLLSKLKCCGIFFSLSVSVFFSPSFRLLFRSPVNHEHFSVLRVVNQGLREVMTDEISLLRRMNRLQDSVLKRNNFDPVLRSREGQSYAENMNEDRRHVGK